MCAARWPQSFGALPLHLKRGVLAYRKWPLFQNQVAWRQRGGNCRYRGLALSRDDEILVTNRDNHCVDVFSIDGMLLRTWGTHGVKPGQFYHPYGIAVTKDGLVVVADEVNCRIQVFTLDGTFVRAWGSMGSGSGQFIWPSGVAVTAANEVVVIDAHQSRIQIFQLADGTFLRNLVIEHPLPHTSGVYVTRETPRDDEYVLVDCNDTIQAYHLDGTLKFRWQGDFDTESYVANQLFALLRGAAVNMPVLLTALAVSRRGRVVIATGLEFLALD